MGCIYETNGFDVDAGICTLWEDGAIEIQGCDEKGYCVVSEDPDPSRNCDCYESDYTCSECGADLNVEECDCEEFAEYE